MPRLISKPVNSKYHAIRSLKKDTSFGAGDVLVLFGELFSRGYANGLVEEAEKRGLTIVRATVGRREKDGTLRKLTAEEIANIPKPFVNVPLEAGFDLETPDSGLSPVEQIKDVKLSAWEDAEIDWTAVESSKQKGRARFKSQVQLFLKELEQYIPAGKNVLFAHLMAGGVPRAKIIMPMMNRTVKGTGDRYLSSEKFWNSQLGKLCSQSFTEVTAETFSTLVLESQSLREKIQAKGAKVSYLAYGYHGTEITIGNNFVWQTYTPYLQGWAKLRVEEFSRGFSAKGIHTCVYNCPEILTNSSSIFSGVEVSLYPLLGALHKLSPEKAAKSVQECLGLLKEGTSLEHIMNITKTFFASEVIREHCQFEKWPQHSSPAQLEKMLATADELVGLHKDPKQLLTFVLSEIVFSACGKVMLADCPMPESPVAWINHDLIAKIHCS
jgi:hypothetical protein